MPQTHDRSSVNHAKKKNSKYQDFTDGSQNKYWAASLQEAALLYERRQTTGQPVLVQWAPISCTVLQNRA